MSTDGCSELLTVQEVMARLRLGRSTVYELIRSKALVSGKIGGRRRVSAASVERYIQARLGDGHGDAA
ncbi:hypothetical protein BN159_1667 [Streptomyces davaonensis JCM 4913]|uniref:Helix-turn-helix domain-containing protein n=1 Tax=Streptomyces davaonensis (strain DSM 101723 / JCM 4913 / KCC S-0913 / 768) TaxID=1214101 RepID=K4QTA2_STRDJ|nr:helix-turn-helix domain-containing protein [Streptomyces davaonensis]CCK26046.1 hypothetical protein BN159_1667 [Streptomyces davaonensis JCM 4913]